MYILTIWYSLMKCVLLSAKMVLVSTYAGKDKDCFIEFLQRNLLLQMKQDKLYF